jgi:hypothetical protein
MADYKAMYAKLFNAVTDAINILQSAQVETEELFINQDEANTDMLKRPDNSNDSDSSENT